MARISPDAPLSDQEFFDFRMEKLQLLLDWTPGLAITTSRGNWAISDGRGVALDSSIECLLANCAASRTLLLERPWVLKSCFASLTARQKKRFVHLCPDFVVELKSPSDRLPALKAKMEPWIENGAQLG